MEWVPNDKSSLGRIRQIAGGAGTIDSQSQKPGRALDLPGRSNLSPFVLQIKKQKPGKVKITHTSYNTQL